MMLSDVSDVWRVHRGKSRTERPGNTKIGTEVAHVHVTRTPLSRSKCQSRQAALITAALTSQAAAAVTVGTYWPWEPTATLRSARRREALRRPGGEEGRGYIVAAARLQLVNFAQN